jgi:hypothetical protein
MALVVFHIARQGNCRDRTTPLMVPASIIRCRGCDTTICVKMALQSKDTLGPLPRISCRPRRRSSRPPYIGRTKTYIGRTKTYSLSAHTLALVLVASNLCSYTAPSRPVMAESSSCHYRDLIACICPRIVCTHSPVYVSVGRLIPTCLFYHCPPSRRLQLRRRLINNGHEHQQL